MIRDTPKPNTISNRASNRSTPANVDIYCSAYRVSGTMPSISPSM